MPPKDIGHFRNPLAEQIFRQAYAEAMRALPKPAATQDVPTSFGLARVYRFGNRSATPIVLLPGRAASTPMWEPNLAPLAAQRPVYAIDPIGEPGMSIQSRPFDTPKDQAAWLCEALDGVGIQKAHLVGVSMGGWQAVNLTLYAPDRTASLTLLDPAYVFGLFTWKVTVISLGAVLPFMPQALRMKLLSWISGGAEADETIPIAKLIASGMRDYVNHIPAPVYPSDEQLRTIDIPVLVILAGRSLIHDSKKAEGRAQKLLKKGHVELWPEASHAINGECANRVNHAILHFLHGIESDRHPILKELKT